MIIKLYHLLEDLFMVKKPRDWLLPLAVIGACVLIGLISGCTAAPRESCLLQARQFVEGIEPLWSEFAVLAANPDNDLDDMIAIRDAVNALDAPDCYAPVKGQYLTVIDIHVNAQQAYQAGNFDRATDLLKQATEANALLNQYIQNTLETGEPE